MKDLKTLLFKEALYNEMLMDRISKKYGEWCEKYYTAYSKFFTINYVIEEAGLKNEYLAWKEEQIGGGN